MKTRVPHLRGLAALLLLAGACRNNNTVLVPNRVLDRPLDVSLACVKQVDGAVEVLALNDCAPSSVGDCEEEGAPQLVGFVANSEKNEVGMFRRCDVNGMVDLDPEAPGYNLVPVGTLPSRIVQTTDCRVVTANVGSCDFSAIEGPELAAYAVGLSPSKAPSALVSKVVPLLSDGTPLGAAPGDMIAVPRELSLAGGVDAPADGATDGGTGVCNPDQPASVFVTFPACQLVAEISLGTQRILQSRQFVTDDDGEVQLVDSGPDPECPLECPGQFDGELPERPSVDGGGVFPMALALVQPDDGGEASLFIGGTGSDEVFEVGVQSAAGGEGALGFAPVDSVRRLRLEDPAGISAIRPTPLVEIDKETYQFLYLIAGDGSTHVVSRALDGTSLGVECDTQVDPSQATSRACHPIDPDSQAGAASRRPFAAGPGIRGSDGSTITDWTFQVIEAPSDSSDEDSRSPLGRAGVVGIGVTSFGRVVLAVFGQYDDSDPTIPISSDGRIIDPIGLMNVEIRPHMLWPVTDPFSGEPSILPLVDDTVPDRVLSGEDNISEVLAPTLRRIDRAYYAEGLDAQGQSDFSGDQIDIWTALGMPGNVDRLGGFDDDALYENNAARVAVRDYRQWRGGQTWSVEYEPSIPGTESTTGRVLCENPSEYFEGTCHAGTDDSVPDIQLVDEGATFCDEGVLPGDKLVFFGCSDDDTCGTGRRCLRDPNVGGSTSGICVSSQAYEEKLDILRAACAPFVTNPCGPPRREYTITSATQTELTFVPTDIPATTFTIKQTVEGADPSTPACPVPTGPDNLRPGSDGAEAKDACFASQTNKGQNQSSPADDVTEFEVECEARLTCAGIEQPAGGCSDDSECVGGADGAQYVCFDGLCRTPCEGGSFNCRQTPLPGPGCFGEFVRYSVTLRESLGVAVSPAAQFMTDRVITDPATGECREDPTISSLLTSRIPLGVDEASTVAAIPLCVNDDQATPSDPNPCRIFTQRADDETSLYHSLSYEGEPIEAIRYSNPFGTLVLDLVSPLDLAAPNELPGGIFDACFADFRRARIPRSYRESFSTPTSTGYQAYNDPIVVGSTPMTYPVRVVPGPEDTAVFAVDAGGRGGTAGVRGQVVRIEIREGAIRGDEQFRVR
jgi:hypothetical protein